MTKFLSLMEAVSAPESFTVGGVKFVRVHKSPNVYYLPNVGIGSSFLDDIDGESGYYKTVIIYSDDSKSLKWFRQLFLSAGLESTNNPSILRITEDNKLYDFFGFTNTRSGGGSVHQENVRYAPKHLAYIFYYGMTYINYIVHKFKTKGSYNKIRITNKILEEELKKEGLSVWVGSKVSTDDYPKKNPDVFLVSSDKIFYKNESVLAKIVKIIKNLVLANQGSALLTQNKLAEKDPIFAKLSAKGLKLASGFGRDFVISKTGKRFMIIKNKNGEYCIQMGNNFYYFNNPDHEEIISALLENKNA